MMKGSQKYTRICIFPFEAWAGGGSHFVALPQSSPKTSGATLAQPQYSLLPEFSAWVDYNTHKKAGWLFMGVCTYTHTHKAPILYLVKIVGVAAMSSKTEMPRKEGLWSCVMANGGESLRKLTCAVSLPLWHTWGRKPHPNCAGRLEEKSRKWTRLKSWAI